MTASDIRQQILETVSKNGGHLASSLGAVELAMALAEVFNPQVDRVVWDVGHQSYAWKILTGRAARFPTLRRLDGLSGFPNPSESPCDAAIAGHAGAALSTALGLAAARDRKGSREHVVAVVGDAALANGMSFEALNNCAAATKKVIVVLNDNEMSISRPAGSFARLLGRLITGVRYNRVKAAAEKAGHALKLTFLRGIYHRIESRIKSLFLGNAFFEQFGLRYIGPVDGHDLAALKAALQVAKEDKRSVIVHVVTRKGKGYAPAERDPTKWHGTGPFAVDANVQGARHEMRDARLETRDARHETRSWSDAFGDALAAAAREDSRVCSITAAMKDGTGLTDFAHEFPSRFFDVGIAEEHAVAFAAGLAAGGMRPVVALYSTFLQRAVDQIMHDICITRQRVVLCVDRAGVVGADGVTHQGLYDYAMLKCLPNLAIAQPKDAADLAALLDEALKRNGPTVIRYPRGKVSSPCVGAFRRNAPLDEDESSPVSRISAKCAREKGGIALWSTGDWYGKARAVAARVPGCVAVHARYLKPFDAKLLAEQRAAGLTIVSLENGAVAGGFGETIGADLKLGWPDEFIPHGTAAELEKRYGLDEDSIAKRIVAFCEGVRREARDASAGEGARRETRAQT